MRPPLRPRSTRAGHSVLAIALAMPACAREQAAPTARPGPPGEPAAGSQLTSAPPAVAEPRDLGDGLIVEDLGPGSGPQCPPGASVTINFTASLADGTVYDSSALRARPLSFSLASPGLIRGLKAGIPGMRPGGTRRIRIPWTLGYGPSGREPVPPKTDLVFEIDLLEWKPADPAQPVRPAGAPPRR